MPNTVVFRYLSRQIHYAKVKRDKKYPTMSSQVDECNNLSNNITLEYIGSLEEEKVAHLRCSMTDVCPILCLVAVSIRSVHNDALSIESQDIL